MTKPTLTREDVLHVAALARLDLTEAEVDRFTTDLGAILAYASEIQHADTRAVAPMSHAPGASSGPDGGPDRSGGWRDDTPVPSLDRRAALGNAPDAAAGLFRVPKVRG
jgi:aspartyl-tRNA(Asn)/glutamyl-tRNA(Gln) amidotransferase subunit C